jgi:hypothetical protein
MNHPHDEVVRVYHQKLDELQNVERQLASLQPLAEQKKALETDLARLRDVLAGKTPAPAVTIPDKLQT